jgi:hypothetical protein
MVIDLTADGGAAAAAPQAGAEEVNAMVLANGHAGDGQQQLVPAGSTQQPQQVLVVMNTLAGRTLRFEVPFSFLERSLGEVLEGGWGGPSTWEGWGGVITSSDKPASQGVLRIRTDWLYIMPLFDCS